MRDKGKMRTPKVPRVASARHARKAAAVKPLTANLLRGHKVVRFVGYDRDAFGFGDFVTVAGAAKASDRPMDKDAQERGRDLIAVIDSREGTLEDSV